MFFNLYQNKRVLITGHTGFKGTWLTLWLRMLGADVIGVSKDIPTQPSMFQDLELEKGIKHIIMDLRDRDAFQKVVDQERPEIIFHLAAQPIVKTSYLNPHETFTTNAIGTLNVLETIRHSASVRSAVIITSDKAYRNKEWAWGYREDDQLGGEDPYSGSKGCAELVAYSYINSYFQGSKTANIAIARAGNVVGGGDWAEYRIIPDCVRAWRDNQKVILRNPAATRPWQHVLEPLSGYLQLGADLLNNNNKVISEAFNFGPDATVNQPVVDLIEAMHKIWKGPGYDSVDKLSNIHSEAGLLKLCCDKALHRLSWKPTLHFSETVSFTAQWYLRFLKNPKDLLSFTKSQIEEYMELSARRGIFWSQNYQTKNVVESHGGEL